MIFQWWSLISNFATSRFCSVKWIALEFISLNSAICRYEGAGGYPAPGHGAYPAYPVGCADEGRAHSQVRSCLFKLMVHLFNLNCSNGLATRIMPGSNKVPPPNIVTPTTTPGLHHHKKIQKIWAWTLGRWSLWKCFFLLIGISLETVTTFTLEQDKQ